MKYERLTKKNQEPKTIFCFSGSMQDFKIYKRLQELEDKIEQGTLKEIPENAVVLTREEQKARDYECYNLGYETHRQESQKREDYIKTLEYHINDLERALIIARKETAKKYHDAVKELFNKWDCCGCVEDRSAEEWHKDNDKIVSEQFGIEV